MLNFTNIHNGLTYLKIFRRPLFGSRKARQFSKD